MRERPAVHIQHDGCLCSQWTDERPLPALVIVYGKQVLHFNAGGHLDAPVGNIHSQERCTQAQMVDAGLDVGRLGNGD